MRVRLTCLALAIVAAVVFVSAEQSDAARTLMEAARKKEVVDGDLKGAIQQYQTIADKYKSDRAVVAETLVRMAECYQRLGDTEAQKIYERLVREFGDQKEAVTIARVRLARTEPGARTTATTLRKIWAGPKVDAEGGVSPDGRYLSYVDWFTGELALRDLTTGADRDLTNKGTWLDSEDFAEESAISKDGKQVAYSWFADKTFRYELRLANLSGDPNPRRLFDNEDIDWIGPYDWSPDGKWLAVQLQRRDRIAQIGLVAVGDGSLRVLKSVDWRGATRIFFSPDGKYLAFDLPVSETAEQRDVFVLSVDGSREIPAVVQPSQEVVLGWSPDGKSLLFASDRTGSMGIWGLPLRDGKPQGTPELIKADIGQPLPIGLSRSGVLYFGVQVGNRDIQLASFDFGTGQFLSTPVKPTQDFVGAHGQPDWSSDGKYLAYISQRLAAGSRNIVLAIRSVETGQTRELRPKLNYFQLPRWSPDGRSLAVSGQDLKGRRGIYRIDAQTAEASSITLAEPGENVSQPQWSPDGEKLYYRRISKDKANAVIERDVASGNEREVIRRANMNFGLNLSPDGRQIAMVSDDPSSKSSSVMLIPVAGGEPRELIRVNHPQNFQVLTWAPDGRDLLLRKTLSAAGQDHELWLVPISDGKPRKVTSNLSIEGAFVRVHPDGRQVAFMTGTPNLEVWVLENFLPALSAKK
jgi:Tol biopolymer transport system component